MSEPKKNSKFPITERNKVKRLRKRAHYDRETLYEVLDAAVICHMAYIINGQPYCTATAYWREEDTLYWHGSVASRMLKQQSNQIPVCCTVTLLDGLVLARSGFHSSMNYRSAMLFGQACLIEDRDHKLRALDAYVERLFPGRTQEMRGPSRKELNATTVMSMNIEQASAKIRTGPPLDDEEDYAADIWAGVIPIRQVIGPAENCPRLDPKTKRSKSIKAYRKGVAFDEILTRQSKDRD